MNNQPLVSIIIPTYNRAHLIGETLDSVLAQTYQNWECIIVDDGSTDDTDAVMQKFCDKDSRFKYYQRPEEHLPGGNGARNYGFKMSQGEYVNWFDSDDLLSPYFLSNKELELLNGNFDAIVSLSQTFNKISGDGSILWNILPDNKDQLQLNNLVNDFLKQNMLWPPIAIVWKKIFFDKKKELWNEHLKSWQDWEFHIKMLLEKPNIYFKTRDIDTFYRIDSSDKISTKKKDELFFINLKKSIDAVISLLKSQGLMGIFSSEIKNLIARILIKLPIQNGYYKFALTSALKYTFLLKSLFPIKSFILELARQYSISRKITILFYKPYKEKVKFDTTFMKLTKENLK
ncbi:glycosyltransferase family 2 protein [Psychroflexus sediminis]|uniref:Glycosyltransferase involved in cell wall bisynthesis n=1 Tax=Psychroflexus sediminis TaxID=470826 RepID=A0A1G7Z576_9FLAO|nr:glycosyltransferase family 2 protein [Psychroflexus sediminis]SDH03745.1 Glycosyltransferase involved in cell wall bisynthesis [Psychroflexus sediminis]